MKKRLLASFFIFFTVSLVFASPLKKGTKVYVSVKKSALKKDDGAVSKTIKNISYGDCLIVLKVGKNQTQVLLQDDENVVGWINNSQYTTKKITVGSFSKTSTNELALAGKGLSQDAEKAFKQSNSKLNFSLVDEIEKITVSEEEINSFIKEGHLAGEQK